MDLLQRFNRVLNRSVQSVPNCRQLCELISRECFWRRGRNKPR
jgi:hypothetical protein